jgi:hypothetical protein
VSITSALNVGGVATFAAGTAAAPSITTTGDTNTGIFFPAADTIAFTEGGAESLRITSAGDVGIGTASPTEKLHVAGALRVTGVQTTAGTGVYLDQTSGTGGVSVYGPDNSTQGTFRIYTATANGGTGSTKLTLDTSGNLGLGVTPSAWNTAGKAFEFSKEGNAVYATASNTRYDTSNAYLNSSGNFIYSSSNFATLYTQFNGTHSWNTAASGTAGNTVSFTQAMTLDASGNLGVGITSPFADSGYHSVDIRGSSGGQINFGTTSTRYAQINVDSTNGMTLNTVTAAPLRFFINGAESARIDTSSNLLVGTTSGSSHIIKKAVSVGSAVLEVIGNNLGAVIYNADGGTPNAGNAVLKVWSVGATGRSINAAGTINASGADYAEYMTKASDFVIAKGDVCGIDANGKLTNVYADAVSFVVKSTNPSYVGNDDWGGNYENDAEGLEAARQKVDRIAFAGQVPVNVLDATPGQYIVPANNNGAIKGVAVSNPSFEQYQAAVGKVIAVENDGRARIIVKIA